MSSSGPTSLTVMDPATMAKRKSTEDADDDVQACRNRCSRRRASPVRGLWSLDGYQSTTGDVVGGVFGALFFSLLIGVVLYWLKVIRPHNQTIEDVKANLVKAMETFARLEGEVQALKQAAAAQLS